MATTATYIVRDLLTDALRKIGVVAVDDTPTADQIDAARRAYDRMVKAWQSRRYNLWTKASMTVVATTSPVYTLSPVRPLRLSSVRWKSGTEMPMQQMTRDEYDRLPAKNSTGVPTSFYYDRQAEAARLYVWPVPVSVATETLEITYEREITDAVLGDAADIPGEWWDAVVYGLADRLSDDYGAASPRITERAERELQLALADDSEESVYFAGPYA